MARLGAGLSWNLFLGCLLFLFLRLANAEVFAANESDEKSSELRVELCEGLTVYSIETISFTETEKTLICDGFGVKAWGDIPMPQKKYLIRNFLQSRGYHTPEFTVAKEHLIVRAGEKFRLETITISSNIENLDPWRYWQAYGRPMTSEALDKLEQWILKEYGRMGYVCAILKTRAYPLDGLVAIDLQAGEKQRVVDIQSESIPKVVGGVSRRYDAFRIGEILDAQDLQLSAKRAMEDEFVVSTSYSSQCQEQGAVVKQRFMPGEPHLVSFGIGFDTEEYAITETRWKNTRMTEMASSLDASFRASYRRIQAHLGFDWYYAPIVMRHQISSEVEAIRENEDNFEARSLTAKVGPSWYGDWNHMAYKLWPHLSIEETRLVRGEGRPITKQFRLALTSSLQSHDYEFFRNNPRSGFAMNFQADTSEQAGGSNISVSRFFYDATYYHNLWDLDPAIWIVGLRTQLATVIDGKKTTLDLIPANLRLRLGGMSNIRGFGRQQIAEEGAFTTAYLGAELRIDQALPFGLQPIFLVDAARVGRRPMQLESNLYWAPGFGVYWASFIGTIRSTLAYGFTSSEGQDTPGGWHHYMSLGEQF